MADIELPTLDYDSDLPPHLQIAQHLREAIKQGRLVAGDPVPSQLDLIDHYAVDLLVVRNAFRQLSGLIYSVDGSMFVDEPLGTVTLSTDGDRVVARHESLDVISEGPDVPTALRNLADALQQISDQ